MENRFGITEKDMVGDLKGFPIGIAVKMLEEQESQGTYPDIKVFQNNIFSAFYGFVWEESTDGYNFWNDVLRHKHIHKFYEKYPDYRKYDNNEKETNMNKELEIVPPEGYEIDKERSTFERIVFKKIEKSLPKTWEEFCMYTPKMEGEYYVALKGVSSVDQNLCINVVYDNRRDNEYKSLLPDKETAEAMLALCQLIQLRDCYNDGWTPDWMNDKDKEVIIINGCNIVKSFSRAIQRTLTFKTAELRDQFLENFKGLIEIAKPLL